MILVAILGQGWDSIGKNGIARGAIKGPCRISGCRMGKTVAQLWHVAAPHVECDLCPPRKEGRGKDAGGPGHGPWPAGSLSESGIADPPRV